MATPFHENRVHHWMPCLFHVLPNITGSTWNTEICTRRSQSPTIIIDSWWLTTLHQLKMHHLKRLKKIWFHVCIFPYRVQANTNKIETTSISNWSFTFFWLACKVTMKFHEKTKKSNSYLCWIWWIRCGQLLSFLAASRRLVVFSEPNLQRITINCDKSGHIKKWHSQHWCNSSDTSQKKRLLLHRKNHSWG